ncbi:MAG: hypothetical protein ACXWV5_06340 [Flavitalea sp.]
MKIMQPLFVFFAGTLLSACNSEAQPSTEIFKETFVKRLQSLRPEGYEKRTVKLVQVTAGKTNSGTTSYKVTAYIHDYDEGYPPNKYYGQTCLGKMDNWVFTMHKDDFGEWMVQGKFTVTDNNCQTNTSQGVASQPVDDVPGTTYEIGKNPVAETKKTNGTENKNLLYIGEYAAYGTGGRPMAGMGMILTSNNRYYDLDKKRGGTYSYDKKAGTISFHGGFLSGQTGKNVNSQGFDISETVHYEPYR